MVVRVAEDFESCPKCFSHAAGRTLIRGKPLCSTTPEGPLLCFVDIFISPLLIQT